MPIYEYQCRECNRRLEALQRLSEPPLTTCPECGGELKKLFSAPAFQFKGGGWYVTDYARKKDGGEAAGEKTGEGKEAGKEGGTESKDKGDKAAPSEKPAAAGPGKGAGASGD